ncbi:MAG: agmatine deiminase family protein [Pseudomonadota bacterium]
MSHIMPPEWAPHERCWMAWPCRDAMWSDYAATCSNYAAVAHAIRQYEPVTMVVPPEKVAAAHKLLGSDIEIFEIPIDDSWARDSGPCFVLGENGLAGVSFTFNAWGGKYEPHDQDALMADRIIERIGAPVVSSALVAEGGGLNVDGEGTLLTTDTCFPNANRNPEWSIEQIEQELMRTLGVEKVVWLPGDPLDQETDGHVDGIACFTAPGKVIIESTDRADDPRKPFFDSVRSALEQQTDAKGRPFELLTLPEAGDANARGDKFCVSYVNFYIANGGIVAPAYDIPDDDLVRERLADYYPGRDVTLVNIDYIAEGGGGIHCITQQQPAVA